MAASNELGRGRGRGYELNEWIKEHPILRQPGGVEISRDEVHIEEMGKVVKRTTGTQTVEGSKIWPQEKPVCVVRPNNHLRTGGRRDGGIGRGELIGL